jgi:predicted Zn-ribbon and HTH transcriptional regulator
MSALRVRKATVYDCTCERCGHKWLAFKLPTACAKCKSRSWNVPEGSVPLGRPPKGRPDDRG